MSYFAQGCSTNFIVDNTQPIPTKPILIKLKGSHTEGKQLWKLERSHWKEETQRGGEQGGEMGLNLIKIYFIHVWKVWKTHHVHVWNCQKQIIINPPRSWYWNIKHIKTAMWVSHCLKDIYETINSRKYLFGLLVSEISVCVQLVHLPWSQGDAKYHYSVAVSKNAIQPMVARKQREAGWSEQDRHSQSISPGTDFV